MKFTLTLTTILLAFVCAECFLQFYVRLFIDSDNPLRSRTAIQAEAPWTIYDAQLGWKNRPGAEMKGFFTTNPGDVRINAHGLRADRDYAPQSPPGVTRALALGDSFTFGFSVGNGLDWPSQLDGLDPALEVLNLGVCGYGFDQMVLAYEQAAGIFDHDLVILGFFNWDVNRATNDYTHTGYPRPLFRIRQGRLALTNVPTPPPKAPGSAIYGSFILTRFWRTTLANREVQRFLNRPDASFSWNLGRLLLRRLKSASQDAGARMVAVDIPWYPHLEMHHPPILEFVPQLFEQEKIPYLDLHPVFRARINHQQLYDTPQGGHCSPAGYRLIAEQARALIRRTDAESQK